MKKTFTLILAFALILSSLFVFASCGKDGTDKTLKVGIIQYMSHPSLDNCYEGIKAALEASELDIIIDRQIGSGNSAENDTLSFARNMVASEYDLIIAIATPAAVNAFNATDGSDIPVIFCAVSDPVAAGLVDSLEKPGEACTGTSDILDLDAQVDLIQAMQPDVKKIGVIYTASETNSISNLAVLREICETRGLEVVAKSVQNAADVPSAAEAVAAETDCINNFTDNNVVYNLKSVLAAAEKYGIAVYGSEVEQVSNGCLAAVSIDYVALGKTTGEMAIDVLNGEDASKMAVKTISDATPVVNTDVLEALGLTLPEAYENTAEKVTTAE
ncbi:MAG: ABC transporter substrate-binding protein [Clostridia bacterium]|nr:ABC transporter substrate-binding protein [Clostridia bacterium]